MMLSKNSSVSLRMDCAQVVVEIREQVQVRVDDLQVPQMQPLAGEIVNQRLATRVGQHAPHLLFQDGGSCSLPWLASAISGSSGMLLHRKNDRREASSRSLMR